MNFVFAAYRSRSVAMQAYNYLVKCGVTAALISTPRGANVGCGLSVKFPKSALDEVSDALADAETFAGIFLMEMTQSGTLITALRK